MAQVAKFTIKNPGLIAHTTGQALDRVALEVLRDARRAAPRSPVHPPPKKPGPVTGNLKNSIQVVNDGPEARRIVVGAHYGIYQEFGTRHIPARPFLGPAIEKARAKYG